MLLKYEYLNYNDKFVYFIYIFLIYDVRFCLIILICGAGILITYLFVFFLIRGDYAVIRVFVFF